MLGNRGGKFHRDDRTLGKRRWATHHWICCELHYKGTHHEPMGKGYTSLFFLDEVTALAAGHRPCFTCRHREAKAFMTLAGTTTQAFDRTVHAERLGPSRHCDIAGLPDGVAIDWNGAFLMLRGDHLLRWSFAGYAEAIPRPSSLVTKILTPPAITAILAAGYEPRWHASALQWG